jgi:hypothetical protein
MKEEKEDELKKLLRSAMPPVGRDEEPQRDLWPDVLRGLRAMPRAMPWFDWALLGGLVAMAAVFPVSISLFLYYL